MSTEKERLLISITTLIEEVDDKREKGCDMLEDEHTLNHSYEEVRKYIEDTCDE